MAKYRIKKGYYLAPVEGKLTRKVFAVQKRLCGIWFNVLNANVKNDNYFQDEKQAKIFLKKLIDNKGSKKQ